MSRKILIAWVAIVLFAHVGAMGAEAPDVASAIPGNSVAAVFIKDFPTLAKGKAWLRGLSEVLVGEVAIALLDIPKKEETVPLLVMGKVNPQKFGSFMDARLKPILRRNLGRVEFKPSEGITEIAVNDSPTAFYSVKDDVLRFSLDRKIVVDLMLKPFPADKSLKANLLFAKVLSRAAPKSRSVLFVNVKRILDTFGERIPEQTRSVLKTVGILDIEALGGCDESVDGAQSGSFSLVTSGKPRGFLALLATPAAPAATARYVPPDYSFYARARFSSFSDAWGQVMKMMQEMPAGGAQKGAAEFLDGFSDATGMDFKSDVLDSLGGEAAVAVAVPESLRIPDGVALLEVTKRENVEKLLGKIMPLAAQEGEYKGVAIRRANVGPVRAAYGFVDKYLVVGTDISVLKAVVDAKTAAASLADNPAFRSAVGRLGEGGHLFYLDAGSTLPIYLSVIRRFVAESGRGSAQEPPTWEVVGKVLMSPLLTDALFAFAVSGDSESVIFRGYSTVMSTYNWMAGSSILAGMMLPAMSRARESARRAACMNNLRQLLTAEKMWSADHDAKFTEKLSELYPEYVTTLDVFACPSAGGLKITEKEDIDSLTSYVLRKGLTEASPPNEVLIYEKMGNHRGDGGNAAYVDGHVKWLSPPGVERIIEKDEGK